MARQSPRQASRSGLRWRRSGTGRALPWITNGSSGTTTSSCDRSVWPHERDSVAPLHPLAIHSVLNPDTLMKRSFPTAALTLFLLLSPFPDEIAYSQAPGPGAATAVTKVEIPETQLRRVTSSANGRQYLLYVHLPPGYSNATATYP